MDYLLATRISLVAAAVFGIAHYYQERKAPTNDPWFVPVILILIWVSFHDT
jgi:hypothetical protein